MTPTQHAAAVVAVAQAHEAIEHLGIECVVTVQPWGDPCAAGGFGTGFDRFCNNCTPGALATAQTIGAVGFHVLSVFVAEVGP